MNDSNGSTPFTGENSPYGPGSSSQNGAAGQAQQGYPAGQYAQNGHPGGYPQNGPQQGFTGGYPQQWAAQEPPKQKNFFARHKILTGVLGLCLVGGIAAAAGGGSKKNDTPTSTSQSARSASGASSASSPVKKDEPKKDEPKKDALPAIGTPVRDGKFEFTVTSVERNVPSVGDQYLGEKAQGSFTLVHVTVKNISTDSQTIMADGQKAYDADGVGYEANSSASIYVKGNDTFFKDINPGNLLKGVFVFDAPAGKKLTKVRLHDSMFSNGVEASL